MVLEPQKNSLRTDLWRSRSQIFFNCEQLGPCSPKVWKSPKMEILKLLCEKRSSASFLSFWFLHLYIQLEVLFWGIFGGFGVFFCFVLKTGRGLLAYCFCFGSGDLFFCLSANTARWTYLCFYESNLEHQLTNSLDYANHCNSNLDYKIMFFHRSCANSPKLFSIS